MLKQLVTFFFIIFTVAGQAQTNLVPNGSFEYHNGCPQGSDLYLAYPWFAPTLGSPDYFNPCGFPNGYTVPQNGFGFQYASDGNSYCGLQIYDSASVYHEYISVNLIDSLYKDTTYCISFDVSLAEVSKFTIIDSLSISFLRDSLFDSTYSIINVQPQITFNKIYPDTVKWHTINATYIPTKNEKYMYVGNFNKLNYSVCYLYMDNFKLIKCNPIIQPKLIVIPNIITPNGDNINDFFFITSLPKNSELIIFNRWGSKVFETKNYLNNWQPQNESDGVYYYILNADKKSYNGFLTIMK